MTTEFFEQGRESAKLPQFGWLVAMLSGNADNEPLNSGRMSVVDPLPAGPLPAGTASTAELKFRQGLEAGIEARGVKVILLLDDWGQGKLVYRAIRHTPEREAIMREITEVEEQIETLERVWHTKMKALRGV